MQRSAVGSSDTRQLDPTYDLLDRPVALGGADDVVLTAPAPDTPTIDGRPVEDPRLVEALSVPQRFSRADVLDRAAKLGGVLRVLGADGASRLIVSRDLPAHVRAFAVLAGVRIGVLVDDEAAADAGAATRSGDPAGSASPASPAEAAEADADADAETLTIRPHRDGESTAENADSAIRTAVRSVRSHFEGIAVEGGGQSRDLDRLVRDSRIQPAASRPRDAQRPALVRNGTTLTLAEAAGHLEDLLMPADAATSAANDPTGAADTGADHDLD